MTRVDRIIRLCLFVTCCLSLCKLVLSMPQKCFDPMPRQNPYCGRTRKVYHFDTMKGKCIQLAYNGCGRSNNVFSSKESCQKSCSCHLEPNWGVYCGKKYRIRYYYEQESGLCRKFWFSGCGGNHNRFEKKTRCEKVCTEYRGLKHEIKSLTKLIEKDLKEIQKG